MLEQGGIGFEEDVCAVLVLSGFGSIANEDALLEDGLPDLSVAIGVRLEMTAQRIHRLQTYTIQANTLLESLGVILATGVQHGHRLHQFALGNSASIVADAGTQVVLDVHLYALAGVHLELVDTVVYDLLQQNIYTILWLLAIAKSPDVHTRSGADMLHVREMPDITLVVSYFLYLRAFLYIFHGLGMQVCVCGGVRWTSSRCVFSLSPRCPESAIRSVPCCWFPVAGSIRLCRIPSFARL